MKNYLIIVVVAILSVIGVFKATKIKQNTARRENRHVPYGPYEAFFKRPLDLILSVAALIILSPLLLVIAVLVRINLGSPIMFKQERPGRIDPRTGKEKIFTLYKYRTMSDKRNEHNEILPDSERLTTFGRKLRETSADELGELINIVRGDMSIVGARPLLVEYLPYYTEEERHRHDVRPGLTGLAQVSGRNLLGWDERIKKDIEYVNHISFLMDFKIVVLTVKKVLNHSGVSADTSKAEPNFADERRKKLANGKQV